MFFVWIVRNSLVSPLEPFELTQVCLHVFEFESLSSSVFGMMMSIKIYIMYFSFSCAWARNSFYFFPGLLSYHCNCSEIVRLKMKHKGESRVSESWNFCFASLLSWIKASEEISRVFFRLTKIKSKHTKICFIPPLENVRMLSRDLILEPENRLLFLILLISHKHQREKGERKK